MDRASMTISHKVILPVCNVAKGWLRRPAGAGGSKLLHPPACPIRPRRQRDMDWHLDATCTLSAVLYCGDDRLSGFASYTALQKSCVLKVNSECARPLPTWLVRLGLTSPPMISIHDVCVSDRGLGY